MHYSLTCPCMSRPAMNFAPDMGSHQQNKPCPEVSHALSALEAKAGFAAGTHHLAMRKALIGLFQGTHRSRRCYGSCASRPASEGTLRRTAATCCWLLAE